MSIKHLTRHVQASAMRSRVEYRARKTASLASQDATVQWYSICFLFVDLDEIVPRYEGSKGDMTAAAQHNQQAGRTNVKAPYVANKNDDKGEGGSHD